MAYSVSLHCVLHPIHRNKSKRIIKLPLQQVPARISHCVGSARNLVNGRGEPLTLECPPEMIQAYLPGLY